MCSLSCLYIGSPKSYSFKSDLSEFLLTSIAFTTGHIYWVTFIDDHSRFPTVYFLVRKSNVFNAFVKYKAWAENLTNQRIGILRDDKGGEYVSKEFDRFLSTSGIQHEHLIQDTPQQLGVAERMNCSIAEGVMTALSQSGLG